MYLDAPVYMYGASRYIWRVLRGGGGAFKTGCVPLNHSSNPVGVSTAYLTGETLGAKLRNVSLELRNVSFKLRNVSFKLRNVSFKLRNVIINLESRTNGSQTD